MERKVEEDNNVNERELASNDCEISTDFAWPLHTKKAVENQAVWPYPADTELWFCKQSPNLAYFLG